MKVHKWTEIRARRFAPEQIEAIQEWVGEELLRLEISVDPEREEQAQSDPIHSEVKPTLFGSIQASDITDEMIEHARKDLFRELDDL